MLEAHGEETWCQGNMCRRENGRQEWLPAPAASKALLSHRCETWKMLASTQNSHVVVAVMISPAVRRHPDARMPHLPTNLEIDRSNKFNKPIRWWHLSLYKTWMMPLSGTNSCKHRSTGRVLGHHLIPAGNVSSDPFASSKCWHSVRAMKQSTRSSQGFASNLWFYKVGPYQLEKELKPL